MIPIYLRGLTLSEGLEKINPFALQRTTLTEMDIPSTVKTISKYAFTDSSIGTIVLPENVSEIGTKAFSTGMTVYVPVDSKIEQLMQIYGCFLWGR